MKLKLISLKLLLILVSCSPHALADDAAQMVAKPLDMYAQVLGSASKGGYHILCLGADNYWPGNNFTIGEGRDERNHPLAMDNAGGGCVLVTTQSLHVDQMIKLTVYKMTDYIAENGDHYAQFTDDITKAVKEPAPPPPKEETVKPAEPKAFNPGSINDPVK